MRTCGSVSFLVGKEIKKLFLGYKMKEKSISLGIVLFPHTKKQKVQSIFVGLQLGIILLFLLSFEFLTSYTFYCRVNS